MRGILVGLDRKKKICMKKFISAFCFACSGISFVFRTERNFRVEIACVPIVLIAAYFFKISETELMIILLHASLVLSAEIFNTSVERLANLTSREINPAIKIIKDTAAGAVLITALSAAGCGAIIFIPKIIHFFISF